MLNKILRSKRLNMILSIVVAVILWAYVITEENPTITQKFENIPVQILNAETLTARDLVIVVEEVPTVTLTIEGKRAEINKLSSDDITVSVDVYGYSYGENNMAISVDVPNSINVIDLKPARIKIKIDSLVTETRPIVIKPEGVVKGQEMHISEINPEEVTITGARSIIENVAYIEGSVPSAKINDKQTQKTVDIFPVDKSGQVVDNVTLSTSQIEVQAQMLKTKEVPLNLQVTGEVSSKYSVSAINIPEKVVIKGLDEVLDSIDSVKANDVNISEVTATSRIPIDVKLPEGAYLTNAYSDLSVYIVIDNVASKEIEIPSSSIEVYGLDENFGAHVTAGNLTVAFRGSEALVNTASENDVTLQVNLSGLGEGTHTVDVSAVSTKGFKSVTVNPKQIQVTIYNEAQ